MSLANFKPPSCVPVGRMLADWDVSDPPQKQGESHAVFAQMAFGTCLCTGPHDGSLTSSFIPAGRLKKTRRRTYEMAGAPVGKNPLSSNNRAPQSAHTSAGASSIVVTAYMVRVSMSCGISTIPICACSKTRLVYPPTPLHGRTGRRYPRQASLPRRRTVFV